MVFVNGSNVSNVTLSIDGGPATNVRLGELNVTTGTMHLGTTASSNISTRMWHDGTYWQIYGSTENTDTTYSEISSAEITAGTASTARAITGRRAQGIVDKAILATKEALYPVGSTYFNKTNSTNPATLLGFGTWARLEGVVLGGRSETGGSPFNVAAGTVIGADTHTLTTAEMPSHTHTSPNGNPFLTDLGTGTAVNTAAGGSYGFRIAGSATQAAGSGGAHNNIQRTLVGYLWERTA